MNVYDSKGKAIWLGESVGRGGEAVVYRVRGQSNWLAKIYQPAPRQNYPQKLAWMVAHPPENPTQKLAHPSLAWPAGLLFDRRRSLVGYTMPYLRTSVPILDVFNPRRRQATLPRFDLRYLHRTARNLAAALDALHRHGYIAGDLNESNVLVTPSALVTIIDTDSFQVTEQTKKDAIVHRCPVAKLEYTAPELHNRPIKEIVREPEHDAFALGVLVFQLLMDGSHPFRAKWLGSGDPPPIESRIAQGSFPYHTSPGSLVSPPKNTHGLEVLHPEVAELIRRCFIDGHRDPGLRPGPASWVSALSTAEKALIICLNGHLYSDHLPNCPTCGAQPSVKTHPVPQHTPQAAPWRTSAQPEPQTTPQSAPTDAAAQTASQTQTSRPRPNVSFQFRRTVPKPPPATSPPPTPSGARPYPWTKTPQVRTSPGMVWSRIRQAWQSPGQAWGQLPSYRQNALSRSAVWNWARPKITKSLLVGGGTGLLAGALPGAMVGAASWSMDKVVALSLFWALGGAAAGMYRGIQPGYRFSMWVTQHIGWNRVWQAAGLITGALIGALIGFAIGWWAIIPVFIGLVAGAKSGLVIGEKIWMAGDRLKWERIWTVVSAGSTALLGWTLASWISGSGLGGLAGQLTDSLSIWMVDSSASWLLAWSVTGGLLGGMGGAITGTFADFFARIFGLID